MKTVSVIPGLLAGLVLLALPGKSPAGVFLSINIAPPVLQVYEQPLCPTDGFLWQPAYWAYGNAGYYWVPGVWVAPPQSGFLWTPGYWGFSNGLYAFNDGYWGPTVGFYGGVNYGFGYGGRGFDGGRWESGHFSYNTAVMRVNTTVIHNTYVQKVSYSSNRTSFNGGAGTTARPTAAETTMARQHGQAAVAPVAQQKAAARGQTQAKATTENHGQPAKTAAARPAEATNRTAETPSRMATRTTPSTAKPEEHTTAAATHVATHVDTPRAAAQPTTRAASPQEPKQVAAPRAAPQQAPRAASPQEPKQVASARTSAPSHPAPQATHAAAPQHAAAPERPAAKPAEAKEEKK
jgi:hypothetical protein